MRKNSFIILFIALILVFSCKSSKSFASNSFEGTYVSDDGLIDSVTFKDGYCTIVALGLTMPAYPYEKKGNSIYITDPQRGAVEFIIIDSNTLESDTFGFNGTYTKQ